MKVGPGDATGGANFAEERTGIDEIAGLHGDGLEMSIEGVKAQAVVEDDGVARKIEGFGKDYAAALCGVHGSAGERGEVDSAMRRAGLAVEDAAPAEVAAGGHAGKGVVEAAIPQTLGCDGSENGAQPLALGFGAGKLLGIGLNEIGRDFEPLGGELALFYSDAGGAGNFFGGFGLRGEREFVRFGL